LLQIQSVNLFIYEFVKAVARLCYTLVLTDINKHIHLHGKVSKAQMQKG